MQILKRVVFLVSFFRKMLFLVHIYFFLYESIRGMLVSTFIYSTYSILNIINNENLLKILEEIVVFKNNDIFKSYYFFILDSKIYISIKFLKKYK